MRGVSMAPLPVLVVVRLRGSVVVLTLAVDTAKARAFAARRLRPHPRCQGVVARVAIWPGLSAVVKM